MRFHILILLLVVSLFAQGQNLWNPLNGPYGGNVKDIERTATGKQYIATDFGGYSSSDNGATWDRIAGITNFDVRDFEINPSTGRIYAVCGGFSGNYFFSDDGLNWSSSSISGLSAGTKIKIHPTNPDIIFILSNNLLFRSSNGGSSWSQISYTFPGSLSTITINSAGAVVVGCDNNSAFRSLFGGVSWSAGSQITIDGSTTKSIRSLTTFNDKFYALTIDNNVYRSNDGSSNSWTSVINGSFTDTGLLYTGAIGFNSIGNLYLAVDDAFWVCEDPTIATPVWNRKGDLGGWGLTKVLAGANDDVFVTGSTHAVVKSTDQGVNWEQSISGITSIAPQDILETADGRILVADDVGFYLSLDQGQTWQTNKNPPNNSLEYFRKLVELDDASILMLGGYGAKKYEGSDILATVGGTPGGNFMYNFAFSKTTTPGSNLIYGAADQIYKSVDNAVSWNPASFTGLPGSFSVQQLELEDQTKYADQGYLFIRLNDGVTKIYRVKQGAAAAEFVTTPAGTVLDIRILDAKDKDLIYVLLRNGADNSVAYSDDHGNTWTTVTPSILSGSNATSLSVLTDNTVEYRNENMLSVFATGGKVYISYDNGITWTTETYAAPRALFKKIITIDDNYGYMIGQGVRARKSSRPMFIPRAPENFKVASFTFNRATFTWADSSSTEEVYVLEKSIGDNSNYQVETEAGTNSTSILLTNLLPNTTYFFRLYAKGLGGNSPKTTEVSFTTLDNSCPLSIPENRSWTSVVQRTRGPQFATLSPSTHINPDQSYTLTFNATGTELEGAAKVYAHAGLVLDNSENPVSGDPLAPWQYIKGNFFLDDGIGQMSNIGSNQWELTLGPTLRNYFGAPGGVQVYWLGLVFRNADGSVVATNNGVSQDVFISIQKGYIDAAVGIDISDLSTRRYKVSTSPNDFFEACNVVSTLNPGIGSWDSGSNRIDFKWGVEDETRYVTYWTNESTLNSNDPAPPNAPPLLAFSSSSTSNLLQWDKVSYATKYRIGRGAPCISNLQGTGISYVTTDMYDGFSFSDPGPISGTIDIVKLGDNTYTLSDYSFGWYSSVGYTAGPPSGANFILTHDCNSITAIGGIFGETWTYTISNITATTLTFNWVSGFGDLGTTTLTRSDGTSWLVELQEPVISTIVEVDYPNLDYVDSDAVLTVGEKYIYRVAAMNDAGLSDYSPPVSITMTDPLFTPLRNSLNEIIFSGQGISTADLDKDGFDDIVMSTFTNQFGEQVVPLIYRNNQDGTFTSIIVPGMETENVSLYRGCLIADFNDDQLPDLLFTRTNAAVNNAVLKDVLLINQGNFNFTKTKIISKPGYANQFSAITALDITADGKLDFLAVGNGGSGLDPQPSFLWQGNGNGTFTEIKTAGTLTTDVINGIDASSADYDNDGDMDLLVLDRSSNVPVRLFKNNGDNSFSRVNGLDFDVYNSSRWRTSSWGDIDNDGDLDLFVGTSQNLNQSRYLYKNNGDGTFTNQLTSAVTENNASCFGSAFGDLDNDGDLDLVTVGSNRGDGRIFFNNGDGTYVQYTYVEALNGPYQSNIGLALSDMDNDGFLDVIPATSLGLPLTIFSNQAKGVSGNKWVKFSLNGTASNKSAVGARIKVTVGAKNQIREISARTGYGSQSSLTAHFGLGSASIVDQVIITWPSGNVMTLNNLQANQLYVIDEDLAGPVVSTYSPVNGAAAVALDAKLEITFDEVPVGVSGKKIKVFKSSDLVTPVFILDASAGVVSNNKVSFTLPANLELFTQYTVTIDAGSITDAFQNIGTLAGPWTFTTVDNVPPSISFTEVPLLDKGFATTTFSVIATDNAGVASVTMTHRGITSKTSNVIAGIKNGNEWEFTVAESLFDAMGLEYFFTAKDLTNNEARSPVDNTQFHRTRFNLPAGSEPSLSLVGSSGNVTGYRIISIPYELSNNGVSENFEELGGADPKQFRFIRYHETPSPGWDLYPGALNTLKIGDGYFINVRNSTTIKLKEAKTPDFNQGNLFTMNLKKGWNQIGNPYTTQIVWSDVLAYNSNPVGVSNVSKFNGQYFIDPAGAIDPFEGGFVQVENDITLKIPFKGFTSGGRMREFITNNDISKESWMIPISVRQAGLNYSLGAVGMDPKASLTKDDYDLITLPKLPEYLEIYADHPEHFMKQFTRDIVPTTEEFMWEFNFESNLAGLVQIGWENVGNGIKDLYLFDTGTQKIVNMSEVSSYTLDPSKGNQFRIYFGEKLGEKLRPDVVMLGDPYPNPNSGISFIDYNLPATGPSYQVKLEVYDMLGKSLTTLVDRNQAPGFYRSQWNTNFNPPGLYTYRLFVQSEGKQHVMTKKVMVK